MLLHIDFRHDRHARPQLMIRVLALIQAKPHWQTLNHLYIIASCIFRREQAEYGSRAPGDALDMAGISASIRIDIDFHRVTWANIPELRLLEIRGYPDVIQRHDGHQLLSRRDVLPRLRGPFGDDAIDGSNDACVTQVELGLFHGSLGFQCGSSRGHRAGLLNPNLLGAGLRRLDGSGSLRKPGLGLAYR